MNTKQQCGKICKQKTWRTGRGLPARAYRQGTAHVGTAARLHLAQVLKHPEDMPSLVLTLGIPSNLMRKEQQL